MKSEADAPVDESVGAVGLHQNGSEEMRSATGHSDTFNPSSPSVSGSRWQQQSILQQLLAKEEAEKQARLIAADSMQSPLKKAVVTLFLVISLFCISKLIESASRLV